VLEEERKRRGRGEEEEAETREASSSSETSRDLTSVTQRNTDAVFHTSTRAPKEAFLGVRQCSQ